MNEKFYSTTQAAKICQVTPGTIIYWIKQNKLTAILTVGGHRRIAGSELLRLVKKIRLPIPKELSSLECQAHPRILIVDDEPEIRRMIRAVLKGHFPEIQVEEAEDGLVAGWKTTTFRPDLILLDLMMPGLDGFRFCELVRTTDDLKHVRIIAMSGVQGFGFEEKISKIGAHDFLAKPFPIETLKEKMSKQLHTIVAGGEKSGS